MSKLKDMLEKMPPDSSKANLKGKDKTPIDAQKEPFDKSKDLVNSDLSIPRGGQLGSVPKAPVGYRAPGFAPGDNEYSKKVARK